MNNGELDLLPIVARLEGEYFDEAQADIRSLVAEVRRLRTKDITEELLNTVTQAMDNAVRGHARSVENEEIAESVLRSLGYEYPSTRAAEQESRRRRIEHFAKIDNPPRLVIIETDEVPANWRVPDLKHETFANDDNPSPRDDNQSG